MKIKLTRNTITSKGAKDKGDTVTLPEKEAMYLISLGKCKKAEKDKKKDKEKTKEKEKATLTLAGDREKADQ